MAKTKFLMSIAEDGRQAEYFLNNINGKEFITCNYVDLLTMNSSRKTISI